MSAWEPVIGLEVHVQLATHTKAFSPSAIRFGAPPNSLTDPTVLGLPGALPVFNRTALEYAIRLGLAVGGEIRRRSRFARKQYFYPDLPKGYQISQYDEPIIDGGGIDLFLDGQARRIELTRIHLEEDAGKSTHQASGTSLVDLNRAGVPLCEVVSEPTIRSSDEAAEYMRALRRLVRYLGISDGDMEKGQLRCDANVSIRPAGTTTLGTRTELKNINSFKFVKEAIDHEIARQIRILEGGGTIEQETRLWDSDRGISQAMRGKEEALDYRYFPDPDLPPLAVGDDLIESLRKELPELPEAKRARLMSLGLPADDAAVLVGDPELADYFDAAHQAYGGEARPVANWILSELLRELGGGSVVECKVEAGALAELLSRIDDGTISGKIAKDVFTKMMASGDGADTIIEREGLRQISDTSAIEAIVRTLIADNPAQAEQFRAGKTKVVGFFVGQVMKQTKGQANPQVVNEVLARLLSQS